MPDLDEFAADDGLSRALRRMAADTPPAIPLPYAELRGAGLRRRSRRRAGLAALVAVTVLGGGGALLGSGSAGPARSAPPAAAPTSAPAATATALTPTVAPARTVIDTAGHRMTVPQEGGPARVLLVSAGRPDQPTRLGAMTVVAKEGTTRMVSAGSATSGAYDVNLEWCVRLTASDGYSNHVCAVPWLAPAVFGRENATMGIVGLSPEDAKWYFDHTAVGDVVDVVGAGGGG